MSSRPLLTHGEVVGSALEGSLKDKAGELQS